MNQSLQRLCGKTSLFFKKNSSTMLTCLGAVGLAATVITAVKATPKALKLLADAKDEKGEDLTKLEVVKVAGPTYIPTLAIGVSTLACIFGANALSQRQQSSLASAFALVDNMHKEYRNKVKELYGEQTDIKIREAIAKDHCKEQAVWAPGCGSLDTKGETRLFYDEYSKRYFESTIEAVLNAEYHFNRNFAIRGFAELNEFYEFLGLEPIEGGWTLGWSEFQMEDQFGSHWIDFDHRLTTVADDGLECYFIEMVFEPTADYEDY